MLGKKSVSIPSSGVDASNKSTATLLISCLAFIALSVVKATAKITAPPPAKKRSRAM